MRAPISPLRSERGTERLAAELGMRPMRVEDVAVGVSDDLSGVELHDAARTLDVYGQPRIAAAVGIEDARPRVALADGLAVGGDRGVVVVVDDRLDEVALVIEEHVKEAVLVLDRDEDVKPPRRRGTYLGVGEAVGEVEGLAERLSCTGRRGEGKRCDDSDRGDRRRTAG